MIAETEKFLNPSAFAAERDGGRGSGCLKPMGRRPPGGQDADGQA